MTNSIRIDHTGLRHYLQLSEAVIMTNDLLQHDAFYEQIAQHPGFDMANVSPETIAMLMHETLIKMHVDLYYALNSVLNIDGYDDPVNPSAIHLNIWKINRDPASICNSMINACVHAVNAYNWQYSFGHGDISPVGKENTAPYWIGALAQRMVSGEDARLLKFQHDPCKASAQTIKPDFDDIQALSQSIWLTC